MSEAATLLRPNDIRAEFPGMVTGDGQPWHYLDTAATAQKPRAVIDAMTCALGADYATVHRGVYGRSAQMTLGYEAARRRVAAYMGAASEHEVVFVRGATEAINLGIRGNAAVRSGEHIAFSAIEHAAVIDTVKAIGNWTELPVGADGVIGLDVEMPKYVGLLAVMQVNNEIGTIQPIAEMAKRAKETGPLLLVDGVQAAGKMALPQQADMIAVSAHKLHGPKGIGALWVRDGLSLIPHVEGGGQEQGLRSGTLSPALCAGFGAAAAQHRGSCR